MAVAPAGTRPAPTSADEHEAHPPEGAGPPPARRARLLDGPAMFAGWCGLVVAFAVAFAWRGAFHVGPRRAFGLFDDAMISMRYGQNLAAGDGLVWNAGGEHVEGVTNPLWTLWMAALHLVPVDPLDISLLVTGSSLVTILAALWVARRLAQELAPGDRLVTVVAVGLVATFYPLAFWALSGMEVGLMAWLVGVLALYTVRLDRREGRARRRALAVLGATSAAGVAVRLDAVVPVAIVALYCVWRAQPDGRPRVAALVGGPPALALVGMTLARHEYYGDWLPNTYYLKATGTPLGERVGEGLFAFDHILLAHLGVIVLAGAFALVDAGRGPRLLMAALVVGQSAYSVWVGGDAWEIFLFANRYLTVAIVPLAALAAVGLRRASASGRACATFCLLVAALVAVRGVRFAQFPGAARITSPHAVSALGVVAAALGIAALWWGHRARRSADGTVRPPTPRGVLLALAVLVAALGNLHPLVNWWHAPNYTQPDLAIEGWAIAQATAPDAVMAVWLAGNGPYFAERPAVDLLGKSDRHIAHMAPDGARFRPGHNKEDLAWSLATYRPDVVQVAGMRPDAHSLLQRRGYAPLAGTIWVRRDSTKVDHARLDALVEELVPGGVSRRSAGVSPRHHDPTHGV